MFESRNQRVLPRRHFIRRMLWSLLLAVGLVGGGLSLGLVGYHFIGHLGWIDSFLEAAMISTGMGPIAPLTTPSAKIFAACYALFSGFIFITAISVLVIPVMHRVLHKFHVESGS